MLLARSPLLLALLALLPARTAGADPPPPPVDAAGCARGQGSLAFIGCSLAAALLPAAAGAEVTVIELKSDRELPASDALRERLVASVQSMLGAPSPAAAREPRTRLRVELRVEKSGRTVRVTADLRRATGLWQRARKVRPRALLHTFVEAAIDAELRTLIPPPPLVVGSVLKVKAPERGIVALACGALGPDRGQELALISRSNVRVGRISGNHFIERGSVPWSALSPVAPAPLREPIAVAEVSPSGRLRIGISDRRDGVELDGALGLVERFEGLVPAPGGGCLTRSGLGLSERAAECRTPRVAAAAGGTGALDAFAGTTMLRLGRELGTGKLRQGRGEMPALGRVGAQLALGDADADGAPELAYSADVLEPAQDRLTLVTLNEGQPTLRFTLPAAAISAIAICTQHEGPGMAPLALVSGDELWLIQ